MSEPAVDQFATALRALRRAAGTPALKELVHKGEEWQPSVKLSVSSLSDWLTGKAVPADPAPLRFLIGYLGSRITDSSYQRHGSDWWMATYARARAAKQAARGGRPARPHPDDITVARLGIPITDCNAIALEVHPAIIVAGQRTGTLPVYVTRPHDGFLDELAAQAVAGNSRMITLVGGSSTGKTRACWELVQRLDQQEPGRWRVWHPYDPTRPEAAVAALKQAGPHTIIWLNEAQHYLAAPDPRLSEQIAAGLRTLLRDPNRGPVLILATLWREFWNTLTVRPGADQPDPYAQARELLTDTDISIPDTFTGTDLAQLQQASDPQLRYAAEHAETGRITQYLAGAPELETRYREAPPAARAIIDVAVDARRLGHPPAIPHQLLAQAATGYLDDHDWDHLGDDWLQEALAYAAHPCNGARGPLTRIRPRTDQPDAKPVYRLADYLEQLGRAERVGVYPPDSLWEAFVTTVTDADLIRRLGAEAERRGRYQHAIWLYRKAFDVGDNGALSVLAALRERANDPASVEALAMADSDFDEADAPIVLEGLPGVGPGADSLLGLGMLLERVGDLTRAELRYRQADDLGHPDAPWMLVRLRELIGDSTGAEALAVKAADLGSTFALRVLAGMRERVGDQTGAAALCRQAASRGDTAALLQLARLRGLAGDRDGAVELAMQAADRGESDALRMLAMLHMRTGERDLANRIWRFGLTWDRRAVEALIFES